MKSKEQKTAGNARTSDIERPHEPTNLTLLFALTVLLFAAAASHAQSMYKYLGPDGEWIYADRPPDDGSDTEVRTLAKGKVDSGLTVTHAFAGSSVQLTAHNKFHAPVEVALSFDDIRGLELPPTSSELTWIVPARSDLTLMRLDSLETGSAPYIKYRYHYLAGDPAALHRPQVAYRVPFAISNDYTVTQAYPELATHRTVDSYHAVDIAMPIGTDIFAAREGVVFDVASNHFRGGLDPERDGPSANVVRILHDDGTYAIYAHLNTNSIRVKPGDHVRRGQYIADSGNTGFSSGPHLHFAVVRNVGMEIQSLPVLFAGRNADMVVPATGMALTAY